jgi:hypothetical protein
MTHRARGWLGHVFTLQPTVVPWHDVVRSAVCLPGPMALGLALHDRPAALYGSLGALLGVLAERSGTTGQRLTRIALAAAGGLVAMVLGRDTAGTGLVPLLVVLGFATASGVLSSLHPTLSLAGMQLLVQMAIAGGLRLDVRIPVLLGWYAGGVLWVMAGVIVQGWAEHTVDRYRTTAAAVPALLAERVRAGARSFADVELALAEASALAAAARPLRRRTRAEIQAVQSVLERMPSAVTAATAAARCGDATRRDALADDLVAWSIRIRDGGDAVAGSPVGSWVRAPGRFGFLPVRAGYVARVVLCMGLAEIVRQHDPVARGYWILLTVALCMKPDFQPVLARTLQCAAGTVLGVLIAVPLLLLPAGWLSLTVAGMTAGGIPYAVRRNYGLFSVLITPIVLILLALVAPAGPAIAGQRVAETLIGCAIVTVPGYLLWPSTWRPPSRRTMVAVLEALAAWLAADDERDPARIRLYRRLSDLQTIAGHAPFEPAVLRRRRAAWSDVVSHIAEVAASAASLRQENDHAALDATAASVRRIVADVRQHSHTPVAGDEHGIGRAVAMLQRDIARNW